MTLIHRVKQKATEGLGKLRGNAIRSFWFTAEVNAGDLVTPFLLKQYGFTPLLHSPEDTQVIVCGSLMQRLEPDYAGHILGSGFLSDGPDIKMEQAKVLACRGTLTRDRIGAPETTPLGDAGLLMGRYVQHRASKKFRYGVILHFSDKVRPKFTAFSPDVLAKDTLYIDIQQGVMAVMKKIDQCEVILSSSLHGVIFAHAVGIPAVWLATQPLYESRKYKYADYYSAIGIEPTVHMVENSAAISQIAKTASTPEPERIQVITKDLDAAFLYLKDALLNRS